MTVCEKVQSLISAANAKTGSDDATLTDAVQTLVNGYSTDGGEITVTSLSVNQNGTFTAPEGTAYSPVTVSVQAPEPTLQDKIVSPSESLQTINADSGYDGLGTVTVSAISSSYVGSGVTRRAAATITPAESPQTIAADQYLTGAQTIGAIPSDYVGSGVTRQGAKTVTPAESSQIAVASGVYTTGAVSVAAIPSNYIGSSVVIQRYYTGSSDPSASLGNNGDLYLKV